MDQPSDFSTYLHEEHDLLGSSDQEGHEGQDQILGISGEGETETGMEWVGVELDSLNDHDHNTNDELAELGIRSGGPGSTAGSSDYDDDWSVSGGGSGMQVIHPLVSPQASYPPQFPSQSSYLPAPSTPSFIPTGQPLHNPFLPFPALTGTSTSASSSGVGGGGVPATIPPSALAPSSSVTGGEGLGLGMGVGVGIPIGHGHHHSLPHHNGHPHPHHNHRGTASNASMPDMHMLTTSHLGQHHSHHSAAPMLGSYKLDAPLSASWTGGFNTGVGVGGHHNGFGGHLHTGGGITEDEDEDMDMDRSNPNSNSNNNLSIKQQQRAGSELDDSHSISHSDFGGGGVNGFNVAVGGGGFNMEEFDEEDELMAIGSTSDAGGGGGFNTGSGDFEGLLGGGNTNGHMSSSLTFSIGGASAVVDDGSSTTGTGNGKGRAVSGGSSRRLSGVGSISSTSSALGSTKGNNKDKDSTTTNTVTTKDNANAKRPNKRARCDSSAPGGIAATSSTPSTTSGDGLIPANGPVVVATSKFSKSKKGSAAAAANASTTAAASTTGPTATAKTTSTPGTTTATPATTVAGTAAAAAATAAGKPGYPAAPPAKKAPWNVSPMSTHLPSGSQLINPLTNEVDLKPELLAGLTKEEIRKVKNRASAQRSRTRKWEAQEGLKEENERLREELEILRGEMEGNNEGDDSDSGEQPTVVEKKKVVAPVVPARKVKGRNVSGGSTTAAATTSEADKEAMETLIKKLREEVARERDGRMKAEAEIWKLRGQLDLVSRQAQAQAAAFAQPQQPLQHQPQGLGQAHGHGHPINSNSPFLLSPTPSSPNDSKIMNLSPSGDVSMHGGTAEKGQMVMVSGGELGKKAAGAKGKNGKDPKGVLMMVVLFSFALFSLPPHMRGAPYSNYLPTNSNARQSTSTFGRVIPFDGHTSNGQFLIKNSTDEGELDVVLIDTTETTPANQDDSACATGSGSASCPAPNVLGLGLSPDASKKGSAKGKKSFSFTLLRPMADGEVVNSAKDGEDEEVKGGNVEDVLQRWLGLSLFDENKNGQGANSSEFKEDQQYIPGGWVVVDSSVKSGDMAGDLTSNQQRIFSMGGSGGQLPQYQQSSKAGSVAASEDVSSQQETESNSPGNPITTPLTAWDGSAIEMMDLDTEVLSIAAAGNQNNVSSDRGLLEPPFPEHNLGNDPSPTLAPQMLDDPLADDNEATILRLPGSFPRSPSVGQQQQQQQPSDSLNDVGGPSRRIGSLPSTALMALGKSQAEKYMKLELEMDIEVEVSCTGLRRKGGEKKGKGRSTGMSVVGKDEVGRMLAFGERGSV